MQKVKEQHASNAAIECATNHIIGRKRFRDDTIVEIPDAMKEVLFSTYLQKFNWQYIKDRQIEFADKGFIRQLLKLLDLCGPNVKTICDLTVGCGGSLLPVLYARPNLFACAYDMNKQCIKACLHNAGCLGLKKR